MIYKTCRKLKEKEAMIVKVSLTEVFVDGEFDFFRKRELFELQSFESESVNCIQNIPFGLKKRWKNETRKHYCILSFIWNFHIQTIEERHLGKNRSELSFGSKKLWCKRHPTSSQSVKSNTGGVCFCWISIQITMLYTQKYTPPYCHFLTVELRSRSGFLTTSLWEWFVNLQQPISSEPSEQSLSPSHFQWLGMHSPDAQVNWCGLHVSFDSEGKERVG